jgi:NitT/TauT family transport system permease protein
MSRRTGRTAAPSRVGSRRVAMGAAGVLLLALLWEGYKALGPAEGVDVGGLQLLPRTTDLAMPHLVDMVARAMEPVNSSAGSSPVWLSVTAAALSSLGTASVGLFIGSIIGALLALLMQRFRIAERAVLP